MAPVRWMILMLAVAPGMAGAQSATTAPTTNPADMLPLLDGSIRYSPPPLPWKFVGKSDDAKRVSYILEHPEARIDLEITVEPSDVPENMAGKMALVIGKSIRDSARKENRELLFGPKVEDDPRFFLVLHDRTTGQTPDEIIDRRQLYRLVGLNLVNVAVWSKAKTPDEVNTAHAAAENLLDGMRLIHGAAPVVFGRTAIKITTPIDWKVARSDVPNGLVATYSDPKNPARQVIVRAKVLPKEARTDPSKRNASLERMVDEERYLPPVTAKAQDPQTLPGADRIIAHFRATVGRAEGKRIVESRYLPVSDVLVSVRSSCEESDAEEISKIVEAMCATIKPAREVDLSVHN